MFAARYETNGALQWARLVDARAPFGFGGRIFGAGLGVAAFEDGTFVVAGLFEGAATFAPGVDHTAIGGSDFFVARFAGNGDFVSSTAAGGTVTDDARSVVALTDGSCVVTGSFQNTVTFSIGQLDAVGVRDVFLARFAADGSVVWAARASGPDLVAGDVGAGVARHADDTIELTGWFENDLTFEAETLTSAGRTDVFLARYDKDGQVR